VKFFHGFSLTPLAILNGYFFNLDNDKTTQIGLKGSPCSFKRSLASLESFSKIIKQDKIRRKFLPVEN